MEYVSLPKRNTVISLSLFYGVSDIPPTTQICASQRVFTSDFVFELLALIDFRLLSCD